MLLYTTLRIGRNVYLTSKSLVVKFLQGRLYKIFYRRRYLSEKMFEMLKLIPALVILQLSLSEAIRVLQTNPAIELPPRSAQAEVLDSSIDNLDEFTICLRQA